MTKNDEYAIRGYPLVVSGPSGVGKGTVVSLLLERCSHVVRSVSATTRPPRPGEREGIDYFFVSHEQFESMIERNELAEWAKVYGNYYGTPRAYLERQFEACRDVILEIDVQGAAAIRSLYPDGVFIFIVPPSMKELQDRLMNRVKGEGDNLDLRQEQAAREIRFIGMYDYIIINNDADHAADELHWIVKANRLRRSRIAPLLESTGILKDHLE